MREGTTIDNLQIEIEASSTATAGAIDRLAASLQRLEGLQTYRGIGSPATAAGIEEEIRRTESEIQRLGGVIDAADGKIRTLKKTSRQGYKARRRP